MTLLARSCVAFGIVFFAEVLAGCDGRPPPGRDAGPDSAVDARYFADGTVFCDGDADCDDGVECTRDACVDGICRNANDAAFCSDNVFCNGVEQCHPSRGCIPGERITCSDDDVCTIDRCSEERTTCDHAARDLDEDGEADFFCTGGTDCDDNNPAVNSSFPEVCADLRDNDCDNSIDETTCGRPLYDTCASPLVVNRSGVYSVSTRGARADYPSSCGGSGRVDAVVQIDLAQRSSLRVEAVGNQVPLSLSLRAQCGPGGELACAAGQGTATVARRALEAGTYFLIVATDGGSAVEFEVELGAPIEPPTNDTCASPIDVSAGGRFTSTFVEVADHIATTCGFSGSVDLVYTFTTLAERDVRVTAQSSTGEFVAYSLRTQCDSTTSEVRCDRDRPVRRTVHRLPAGTYFLVIEGPRSGVGELTLDVDILDPTDAAAGDSCANAIELAPGVPLDGTFVDKENDVAVSCGVFFRDAVYTFELDAPSDVAVSVSGVGTANTSLRSVCTDGGTQLRCTSGDPDRQRVRNLAAGRYYLVVESATPGTFSIALQVTAPTTPVDVAGNDTCATAAVIPATGGLFHGDTTGFMNDLETATPGCGSNARSPDAAFQLTLDRPQRVTLSTEGSSFNTVLHVHRAQCTTRAEVYCDDESGEGSTSYLERQLDAGTWFIVVDGFGTSSRGQYLLDVAVRDP